MIFKSPPPPPPPPLPLNLLTTLWLWQVLRPRPEEPPEVSRRWGGEGGARAGGADQDGGGAGAGREGPGGAQGGLRGSVWRGQGELHCLEAILLGVFIVEVNLRQTLEEESQEHESENSRLTNWNQSGFPIIKLCRDFHSTLNDKYTLKMSF